MSDQTNPEVDPGAESDVRFTNDEVQAIASLFGATVMAEHEFIMVLVGDEGTRSVAHKLAALTPEGETLRYVLDTALQVADAAAALVERVEESEADFEPQDTEEVL